VARRRAREGRAPGRATHYAEASYRSVAGRDLTRVRDACPMGAARAAVRTHAAERWEWPGASAAVSQPTHALAKLATEDLSNRADDGVADRAPFSDLEVATAPARQRRRTAEGRVKPGGAPHGGLACAICRRRQRVRRSMGGRPGGRRERQVQKRRKAQRCQRTTVAGFTRTRASRQRDHVRESATQKTRSVQSRWGRGRRRRRTVSCCRRRDSSKASMPRDRRADLAVASTVSTSASTQRSIIRTLRIRIPKRHGSRVDRVLANDRGQSMDEADCYLQVTV
jgi:hypothetical protein